MRRLQLSGISKCMQMQRNIVSIAGDKEFAVRKPKGTPSALGARYTRPTPLRLRRELDSPIQGEAAPNLISSFNLNTNPRNFQKKMQTSGPNTSTTDGPARQHPQSFQRPPTSSNRGKSSKQNPSNEPTVGGLIVRLLKMRIIKNMTKNGKYARFSALIATGNGKGGVGIAHSKAVASPDAVSKATKQAAGNIEYFERWQDRTIFHDDRVKHKATILYVRPAAPGAGRRCHPAISEMCRCMGIKDISAKVHGSRHPMNVADAFLLALRRQKTPEMVASESGMRIIDVLKVYQQGCMELTQTLRRERYASK